MAKMISCAPNFSDGVNTETIDICRAAVLSVPGIRMAGEVIDANHNRTCFDYYGDPEKVLEATVRLAKEVAARIDMTKHTGAHPRMGALDVVPLLPLKDVTMDEAVEYSRILANRIWEEAGIPVFYYENSATAPHRVNLSAIRKGQFEGMAEKVQEPEWIPDLGGSQIHPTAGVTAVGARQPMVAFNVNLDTTNLQLAKDIAKTIRYSGGGLKYVKAIGLELKEKGMVQVSMDITDYTKVPLYRVLEMIRFEAARFNVRIANTETIGPYPMKSLIDTALYYLHSDGFDYDTQLLEARFME